VSCAKTAEPIEMQFGMQRRVGSGSMYYMECRCFTRRGTFGVSGRLKSIVKHRICGGVHG